EFARPPEDGVPSQGPAEPTSTLVPASPIPSTEGVPPSGGTSTSSSGGPGSPEQRSDQGTSDPSAVSSASVVTAEGHRADSGGLVEASGKPSAAKSSSELTVHARSYVVHQSSAPRESSDDPGWIDVANAGIRHARAYEYNNQRKPRSMPHNHPGWDI